MDSDEIKAFLKHIRKMQVYAVEGSFLLTFQPEKIADKTRLHEVVGISEINNEDDNFLVLHIQKVPTPEEQATATEKFDEIHKTHPERLVHCGHNELYLTAREYAEAMYKEAKEKGYTILVANEPEKKLNGLLMFKIIDGVEIGYNPRWPVTEGEILLD